MERTDTINSDFDLEKKQEHVEHVEHVDSKPAAPRDKTAELMGDEEVIVTEEDHKTLARKVDWHILPILVWVYFLQTADKSALGYASIYGIQQDAKLVGRQYSLCGTVNAMAQLAWQPFSAWLIVKVPSRYLMTAMVAGWGISLTLMSLGKSFAALMVTRFFLGLFEAGCLPLFSVITSQWYLRSEQPLRVALWYCGNGMTNIVCAALAFALGKINSNVVHSWQLIFIVFGVVTTLTAPVIYWKLDSDVPSARFLTLEQKRKTIQRLKANQTGTGSSEFKWDQVREAFMDPKTYLWVAMTTLLNVGASVTTIFGPLVISGLGFGRDMTSLLNMPFGAVQIIVILIGSWCAYKLRVKGVIFMAMIIPVIIGLVLLYASGREVSDQPKLLVGYYFLAFIYGGNPLIVSWMISNTGGQTKKAVLMSAYNVGNSLGNIIGPNLFKLEDKPAYTPGLQATLIIFCLLFACIGVQIGILFMMNKKKEKTRVEHGKPAKMIDLSMRRDLAVPEEEQVAANGVRLGQNGLTDMTDFANDEMVYLY